MKQILRWAIAGCLAIAGLDLLLALAALLGLIDSAFYQAANLPAIMIYPGGPGSVKASLPIWVPQMAAIGFLCGAALASLLDVTRRFSRCSKTRAAERVR